MDNVIRLSAINSIFILAKEHKKKCVSDDCGVSLFALGVLVAELQGKPLDRDDLMIFI